MFFACVKNKMHGDENKQRKLFVTFVFFSRFRLLGCSLSLVGHRVECGLQVVRR